MLHVYIQNEDPQETMLAVASTQLRNMQEHPKHPDILPLQAWNLKMYDLTVLNNRLQQSRTHYPLFEMGFASCKEPESEGCYQHSFCQQFMDVLIQLLC